MLETVDGIPVIEEADLDRKVTSQAGADALEGICLPAHIDRPSFSLLSNLGFIPPVLPIARVEVFPLAANVAKFALEQ